LFYKAIMLPRKFSNFLKLNRWQLNQTTYFFSGFFIDDLMN
jgi:hypothetical protein